jgi:hypothetical protein
MEVAEVKIFIVSNTLNNMKRGEGGIQFLVSVMVDSHKFCNG